MGVMHASIPFSAHSLLPGSAGFAWEYIVACNPSCHVCRRNTELQLGRATQDTGPHNVDAVPGSVTALPVKVMCTSLSFHLVCLTATASGKCGDQSHGAAVSITVSDELYLQITVEGSSSPCHIPGCIDNRNQC